MEKLKRLRGEEIKRVSLESGIDMEVINQVLQVLYDYLDIYYESFKEFRANPSPKLEDELWPGTVNDKVELSILYHSSESEIEKPIPLNFKKVKLKPSKSKDNDFELSGNIVNDMIKTYLQKMQNANQIMELERAEELKNYNNRMGKRSSERNEKRNEMIRITADIFKKKVGSTRINAIENRNVIRFILLSFI